MVRSGKPESAGDQPSLGDLVALAAKDISALVRYEIALAKGELKVDGQRIAIAAALIAVGVIIIFPGFLLLCFAYAYFLYWAGAPGGLAGAFAFAGLTFVFLTFCAVVTARIFIKRVTGMRLTRKTVLDDLSMFRREVSPDGQEPAIAGPQGAGKGAPAEIPARRLPGLHGHAIRTCYRDQRPVDAPLGERERDTLPRGEQR